MSESINLEWEPIGKRCVRAVVDRREDLSRLFVVRIWSQSQAWSVTIEHGDSAECERFIRGTVTEVYGLGEWHDSACAICTGILTAWIHDAEEKEGIPT